MTSLLDGSKKARRDERASARRFLFLRKFLRHGFQIAAVAPSSPALAAQMCARVDPSRPQTIVELGAGTGAVTEFALAHMHPESRLVALEVDPDFAAILERRCPRAEIVRADVCRLTESLATLDLGRVDLVISSLPIPSLPDETNQAIFGWLGAFATDACYSQLTLVPWLFRKYYGRLFHRVRFRLVVRNLPPGGAYHCWQLRPDWMAHLQGRGAGLRPSAESRG